MPSIVGGLRTGGRRVRIGSTTRLVKRRQFTGSHDQRERRDALERLGFASYGAYLKSDLWRAIRAMVMDRSDGMCETENCGKPAVQVHHLAYNIDTLIGRRLESLQAVCGSCHLSGHRHSEAGEPKPAKKSDECLACRNTAKGGKRFCGPCIKVMKHPHQKQNIEQWSRIRPFLASNYERLVIIGKR